MTKHWLIFPYQKEKMGKNGKMYGCADVWGKYCSSQLGVKRHIYAVTGGKGAQTLPCRTCSANKSKDLGH